MWQKGWGGRNNVAIERQRGRKRERTWLFWSTVSIVLFCGTGVRDFKMIKYAALMCWGLCNTQGELIIK